MNPANVRLLRYCVPVCTLGADVNPKTYWLLRYGQCLGIGAESGGSGHFHLEATLPGH